MFSRKVVWIVLTIVMIVSLDLIIAEFLMDKSPFLTWMVIIFLSLISIPLVAPSPRTKRTYKVVFLAALVVFPTFAFGLYSGLFESVILLDDSRIDISHSAVVFHLRNNGLTDWTISEVKFNNVTFTPKYPHGSLRENLQAGDTAYFVIHYTENIFQWIPSAYAAFLGWTPTNTGFISRGTEWPCLSDQKITPSTFQNGSTYQVVINTGSVLKNSYRFEIEATLIEDEEINVTATRQLYENRLDIWFTINNTGTYYSYIYSIQIANVTFYFEPLIRISPSLSSKVAYYPHEMILSFNDDGLYAVAPAYLGNITSTATLRYSMLKAGTTYNFIVRTMTNNIYITNFTI